MPRPRIHDTDRVLDAVESLAVSSGPAAVTIRAISAAVGVSNGALYHSFGSRAGLLAQAWLRAGRRFLEAQTAVVNAALAAPGRAAAIEAVAAAADTPAAFAEQHPDSCRLLLTVPRDELLDPGLPDDIHTEIRKLESMLIELMIRLAQRAWNRKDAAAVDAITVCIVDLPTAILLRRDRLHSDTAREQLRAAVRAVLEIEPQLGCGGGPGGGRAPARGGGGGGGRGGGGAGG
ncbi:TetR/AcrR family transcriptional regulator, partial [Mycobacterium asiaticum]